MKRARCDDIVDLPESKLSRIEDPVTLPLDMWNEIASHLSPRIQLRQFALVCHDFHACVTPIKGDIADFTFSEWWELLLPILPLGHHRIDLWPHVAIQDDIHARLNRIFRRDSLHRFGQLVLRCGEPRLGYMMQSLLAWMDMFQTRIVDLDATDRLYGGTTYGIEHGATSFARLKSLTLHRFVDMEYFGSLCTALESLSLISINHLGVAIDCRKVAALMPSLKALTISADFARLQFLGDLSQLAELSITEIGNAPHVTGSFGYSLWEMTHLVSLHIRTHRPIGLRHTEDQLVSKFTRLRHLDMRVENDWHMTIHPPEKFPRITYLRPRSLTDTSS